MRRWMRAKHRTRVPATPGPSDETDAVAVADLPASALASAAPAHESPDIDRVVGFSAVPPAPAEVDAVPPELDKLIDGLPIASLEASPSGSEPGGVPPEVDGLVTVLAKAPDTAAEGPEVEAGHRPALDVEAERALERWRQPSESVHVYGPVTIALAFLVGALVIGVLALLEKRDVLQAIISWP